MRDGPRCSHGAEEEGRAEDRRPLTSAGSGRQDVVMRLEYPAGERLFVDFAGGPVPVTDPETGEVWGAQLFVTCWRLLPYESGRTTGSDRSCLTVESCILAVDLPGELVGWSSSPLGWIRNLTRTRGGTWMVTASMSPGQ